MNNILNITLNKEQLSREILQFLKSNSRYITFTRLPRGIGLTRYIIENISYGDIYVNHNNRFNIIDNKLLEQLRNLSYSDNPRISCNRLDSFKGSSFKPESFIGLRNLSGRVWVDNNKYIETDLLKSYDFNKFIIFSQESS